MKTVSARALIVRSRIASASSRPRVREGDQSPADEADLCVGRNDGIFRMGACRRVVERAEVPDPVDAAAGPDGAAIRAASLHMSCRVDRELRRGGFRSILPE